jgi:hypothetical protein
VNSLLTRKGHVPNLLEVAILPKDQSLAWKCHCH